MSDSFFLKNLQILQALQLEPLRKSPLIFDSETHPEQKPYVELWRMQNDKGEGPYITGSEKWQEGPHTLRTGRPAPHDDAGFTKEDNQALWGDIDTDKPFGFESMEHLNSWFSPVEQQRLANHGFKPTKVKAKRVWSSGRQAFYEPYDEEASAAPQQEKKLTASERAPAAYLYKSETYEQETERLRENKKSPEAMKPHKFKAAQWTFPNGHPRCAICMDEERTGGMCEGRKEDVIKSSQSEQVWIPKQDWRTSYTSKQPPAQAAEESSPVQVVHKEMNLQTKHLPDEQLKARMLNDGRLSYYPGKGFIAERRIINRGKNEPLMRKNEEGPIALVHYSKTPSLREIRTDKMGTGAPSQEYKRGLPEVKRSYFYREGQVPEDIVKQGAKSKYTVTLQPHHKLYDLGTDSQGLVKQALDLNQGAWNSDIILNHIKNAGYHGYHNSQSALPGVVALFYHTPVQKEEIL